MKRSSFTFKGSEHFWAELLINDIKTSEAYYVPSDGICDTHTRLNSFVIRQKKWLWKENPLVFISNWREGT